MKKQRALLVAVVIAIPVIWLGGWLLTIWLGHRLPENSAAAYGPVGDMFGASSSLFAGLGLVGVGAVLYADLRDRRRARRPFLLPELPPEENVELSRARWQGQQFEMSLRMKLEVQNATEEPALNAVVEAGLAGPEVKADVVGPGLPFGSRAKLEVWVLVDCTGDVARQSVDTLQAGKPLVMDIKISYSAVNDAAWASSVSLELRCERLSDRSMLAKVLDRHGPEVVDSPGDVLGGTDQIFLRCTAVPGSWKQSATN